MNDRRIKSYGPISEESFLIMGDIQNGHCLALVTYYEVRALGPSGSEQFLILGENVSRSHLARVPPVEDLAYAVFSDSIEDMMNDVADSIEDFFRKYSF